MPENGFVLRFKNGTEKQDCVEAKNCFQFGIESAIRSVKTSKINEARASVIMCCFQTEIESEIKSAETSKINIYGALRMRCCSHTETESNIESDETSKINHAGAL